MSFVQPAFPALLAVVAVVYWALRDRRAQNVWLLGASLVFYGWVHPWFVAVLLAVVAVAFGSGLALARWPRAHAVVVGLTVSADLGLLAAFKVHGWFVPATARALDALGLPHGDAALGLVMPVGLSFYTFQALSYTLDVARGTVPARRDPLDVALFVSFFPQLVAGPIERADHLLPQLDRHRTFDVDRVASGVSLALWGAFQKVCVADPLAAYVHQVDLLRDPPAVLVVAAGIAFGTQILADFAGYTDIARGAARMLGFELVPNFDRPYLARTTPEFWSRWHMSLTAWTRDYVFRPLTRLGRPGVARTLSATLATFLLLGLWHGTSWNFVALGLFHAGWSAVYVLGTPLVPARVRALPGAAAVAVAAHHVLVLLPSGVLFRERDPARLLRLLTRDPLAFTGADALVAAWIVALALTLALPLIALPGLRARYERTLAGTPWRWPVRTTAWTVAALAVYTFARTAPDDFVYFAF